jgi:DUF1680 family protein
MYSGMADVAAITGEQAYVQALDKIWNDLIGTKFYITGGIGAAAGHEGFGPAYDLPNLTAYNETCASIGEVYWNYRLFLLKGESSYYDVLERVLYNGLISGVSLSGDHFFYPNPLESEGQHARSEWFGCACCPSNVCRFIPSVPGYMYAMDKQKLYINLFIGSRADIDFNGNALEVEQKTNYPWQGKVEITLNPGKSQSFDLAVRIPGWAQNQPVPGNLYTYQSIDSSEFVLLVNGEKASYILDKGYAVISRTWKKGDVVSLDLPMPVRRIKAHEKVTANQGRVALQRGPVVYCAEWPEFSEGKVLNFVLGDDTKLTAEFRPDLLSGVTVITDEADFTAIPYFAWANRGKGEMEVWFRSAGNPPEQGVDYR